MKNKKILSLLIIIILSFPIIVCASNEIESEIDEIIKKLNSVEESIFLKNHPIGSIYITTNSSESTVDKMKSKYGGTWVVYASGRTLAGYDSSNTAFSTLEKTGGQESTTLSTSNLPSHSHSMSHTHTTPATTISSSGNHTHSTTSKTISGLSFTSRSAGSHNHGFNTGGSALVQYSSTAIYRPGYEYKVGTGSWWNGHNKNGNNIASAGNHSHSVTGSISVPSFSISSSGAHTHTVPSMTTNSISTTTSGSTGSGSSFTNLDPYITVYIYKRTA